MKFTITFEPQDGTGPFTKSYDLGGHLFVTTQPAHMLWYYIVKCMKEIIRSWAWQRAGKPAADDREKRIAWRMDADAWTAPIDEMIAATRPTKIHAEEL